MFWTKWIFGNLWCLLFYLMLRGGIARNANCTANGCWNWISVLTSEIPVYIICFDMYLFNSFAVWGLLNRHVADTLNENSFRVTDREITDDK